MGEFEILKKKKRVCMDWVDGHKIKRVCMSNFCTSYKPAISPNPQTLLVGSTLGDILFK